MSVSYQPHNIKPGERRQLPVKAAFKIENVKYKVATAADLKALLAAVPPIVDGVKPPVSLDIETTGFDPHTCEVTLIGVSLDGDNVLILRPPLLPKEVVTAFLANLAESSRLICHNAKFEIKWLLHHYGVLFEDIECTFIMRKLLTCGFDLEEANLAVVSAEYLGYAHSKEVRDQFKDNFVITDEMLKYNAIDVAVTHHVFPVLAKYIDVEELRPVYDHIERRLVPLIARMELEGIDVDVDYLAAFQAMLEGKTEAFQNALDASLITLNCMPRVEKRLLKRDATQDQLDRGVTHVRTFAATLNINSPKQVTEVLNNLGFPTKSAAKAVLDDPPFSVESLAEARARFGNPKLSDSDIYHVGMDVVSKLKDIRSASKSLSAFVIPLQGKYINKATGRVHTSFQQMGTNTGRFSSKEPNVQQMPNPKKEGGKGGIFEGLNIRKAFVPPPGYDLLVYDYEACELRILAEITGDEGLIAACLSPDIHRANAAIMFGKPAEDITDIEREIAKTILYTIVYGGGPKRVAFLLRCSLERAKEVIALMYDAFPKMASWIQARRRMAVRMGYAVSMSGRKRYFDVPGMRNAWGRPFSNDERREIIAGIERRGQNMPIQATNADITKLAMVWVDEAIRPLGGKLLLTIHDELVAIAPEETSEECYKLMGDAMLRAQQEFLEVVESKVKGHRGKSWEH